MSQVLDRQRTEYRVPVRHRSPVIDTTLIAIGALVALVGVYFQFAPSSWWLAHFSEAYHLGSYVVGGLFLSAGFGVRADRFAKEDGRASQRMVAATMLAIAALLGVVLVALAWIF